MWCETGRDWSEKCKSNSEIGQRNVNPIVRLVRESEVYSIEKEVYSWSKCSNSNMMQWFELMKWWVKMKLIRNDEVDRKWSWLMMKLKWNCKWVKMKWWNKISHHAMMTAMYGKLERYMIVAFIQRLLVINDLICVKRDLSHKSEKGRLYIICLI